MKNVYKIHEISQLYGIGVDSLRYYEKLGILKPRRDTNGYRLYQLKDLYKLNIIRDLRQLGFSMTQIKEYLDGQNLGQTLTLLTQEESLLSRKIEEFTARRQVLRQRISFLEQTREQSVGQVTLQQLPQRLCVQLSERMTRDEEMDFVIKKLQRKYESVFPHLGSQTIGAFFSPEDLRRGLSNVFTSVFFILEQEEADMDFTLPAGQYLSCFYRGDYTQNSRWLAAINNFAAQNGWHLTGIPFELYHVDNRETMRPEEFLTELQVQAEPD